MSNLVSIIMNCFNGEKYLREAIDSVLLQSYNNWELIFWNNNSDDNSKEIFSEYSDPRLKYYESKRTTNLTEARINAVGKSAGSFISFLDVDDLWNTDKLEKQVPLFSTSSVSIVCSNFNIVNVNRRYFKRRLFSSSLKSGSIQSDLLRDYSIGLLTLMIRKESMRKHGGFDPQYHIIGDFDLCMNLSGYVDVAVVQEPLATLRIHDSNESLLNKEIHFNELCHWRDHKLPKLSRLSKADRDDFAVRLCYRGALNKISENQYCNANLEINRINSYLLKIKLYIYLFLHYTKGKLFKSNT